MARERMLEQPPPTGRSCAAHDCPLPPGCGNVCFVHDRAAAADWPEATAAILRLDPLFHLAERMSNADPLEPVPSATIAAVRARNIEDTATLPTKSSRQYAYGLRTILAKLCVPDRGEKRPSIRERMEANGLTPISAMLPIDDA